MSSEVFIQDSNQSILINSTITSNGSAIVTGYGFQQVNLVVNIKAAPTGTSPTITFTIQEIDPGDKLTTMGNSVTTAALSTIGVTIATLNTTTSGAVKVSWVVGGSASPTFTQLYVTVVAKATPSTQTITTNSTTSTPGVALGYNVTSSKTNVVLQASTYVEQSTNFSGSIKSANANDTAAGTGARTVTIYYVDQTGATAATESVTLNGTTAVNLINTNHCFIEKMVVETVGTGGTNAGIITLFTGSAGTGTAVAIINAGDKQTFLGHHYVVSGKTCNITGMTGFNNNASNQTVFTIVSTSIPVANQISIQVSDWITGYELFQPFRIYDQLIKVVGPAHIQMFSMAGSTSNIQNNGSFDFFDQ